MFKMLWGIACFAYANGIRDLVVEKIDDPNSDWDNYALGFLDRLFNYDNK